jgi:membrane protein implicated in regulation of membrane protease activity
LVIAWIAAGSGAPRLELHHFAFYALFAAVGCFAGALVALFAPGAIAAQVLAAVLVAVVGIFLIRPRMSAAMHARHGPHHSRGVHGGFVGQEVVTLDRVGGTGSAGHVNLAGERWLAISGCDVALPAGTKVMVTGRRGDHPHRVAVGGHVPIEGLFEADSGPLIDDGEQEQS